MEVFLTGKLCFSGSNISLFGERQGEEESRTRKSFEFRKGVGFCISYGFSMFLWKTEEIY
jgi:hypothetical protein